MTTLTSLLSFIVAAVYVAAASAKTDILPISSRLTADQLSDLRRRARGCNANVCFAIDGSGSISSQDFEAQIVFVGDAAAVLHSEENPVKLAAVQYGNTTSPISRLTVDVNALSLALVRTTQLGSPTTAVGRGINFCIRQLRRTRGEANKIVLLGDGRSTIGPNAVRRADLFRRLGGEVCAVGAGFSDDSELLAIAGGDPEKVFVVGNFIDVLELQFIIENLVDQICGDAPEVSGAPTQRNLN